AARGPDGGGLPAAAVQLRQLRGLPQRQAVGRGAQAGRQGPDPRPHPEGGRGDRRLPPGHRRPGVVRAPQAPGAGPGLFHDGHRPGLRPHHGLEKVAQMIRPPLFVKTLLLLVLLFGSATAGIAALAAWNVNRTLTREYQSKGAAIARSVADSSVEVL